MGLLAQEAVAGVDRVHVGNFRSRDDTGDLEIAFRAGAWADADGLISEMDVHRIDVRLRINGHRFDIKLFAGADDTEGDFTTVGDENFAEHEKVVGFWVRGSGLALKRFGVAPRSTRLGATLNPEPFNPERNAHFSSNSG